ncbi:hypothetical protein [Gimesia fumaroli]|jgi:uncharacterized membrane protein YvbJ|uniref:Uncharacterized protein n=1 Tax=Gimesia fumaroli TaxID=2527976 RepID=A0A518IK04_9PLAN|nr:hypothetical protein [Gimesia fumaroli]QDV53414.1 hypothetical protein Enr17x_54890 [Gimesia fumaroli]
MNSPPEPAETPEPAPKPKKKVSAQRRIVSWIFIAILLGIVLFEWRAKSSQANTVQSMETAMAEAGDRAEFPFTELQEFKQGNPSEEVDESGAILRKHHYRWNGIFKTYDLRVLVDEHDMVVSFDTLKEGDTVGGIRRILKKNLQALKDKQMKLMEQSSGNAKPAVTEKN